ncbi:diuretic hormone receptor-like isoform X1, partial [Brachionus plicatilis]
IMIFFSYLKIFVYLLLILRNSDGKYQNSTDNFSNTSLTETTLKPNPNDSSNKMNILFKYFNPRKECKFELNSNEKSNYCPSTADYLFCFPSTPPNKTIYLICPFTRIQINKRVKASRFCQLNGTWASTDFSPCLGYLINNINSGVCKIKKVYNQNISQIEEELVCDPNVDIDTKIFKLMTILNFIGFVTTVIFVSFAIWVFLSIRTLRCIRNMIHCNMLFTFLIKSLSHICFYVFILSKNENVWDYNHKAYKGNLSFVSTIWNDFCSLLLATIRSKDNFFESLLFY